MAEIFLRLIPLLAARGLATLEEARNASRRTHEARLRY
jgi:DNA polymerase-3 subunit epsilon